MIAGMIRSWPDGPTSLLLPAPCAHDRSRFPGNLLVPHALPVKGQGQAGNCWIGDKFLESCLLLNDRPPSQVLYDLHRVKAHSQACTEGQAQGLGHRISRALGTLLRSAYVFVLSTRIRGKSNAGNIFFMAFSIFQAFQNFRRTFF